MVKALRQPALGVTAENVEHWKSNAKLPEELVQRNAEGKTPSENWETLVYHCELITPMYGGGVEPGQVDKDMPIRATEIRGHLRFWWRLLNKSKDKNDKELFEQERKIWGGLGKTPEAISPSEVIVQIKSSNKNAIIPLEYSEKLNGKVEVHANYRNKQGIQYGLFSAKMIDDDINPKISGTILKEHKFDLIIKVRKNHIEEIKRVFSYWIAFGGVGARIRRGFGTIKVSNSILNNDVIEKIEVYEIPSEGSSDLNAILLKYMNFRQGENNSNTGYGRKPRDETDNTNRKNGRSRWPEADIVRKTLDQWFGKNENIKHKVKNKDTGEWESTGSRHNHAPHQAIMEMSEKIYPRGQFGLPIVMHFVDHNIKDIGNSDPADTIIIPDQNGAERLASPMILKSYTQPNGGFKSIIVLLPNARTEVQCKIKDNEGSSGISASNLHPAWNDPIDEFIRFMGATQNTQFSIPIYQPDKPDFKGHIWEEHRVKYNKNNQTFSFQGGDKSLLPLSKNRCKEIYENFNSTVRQAVANQGLKLYICKHGSEIITIQEAAP